MRRYQRNRKEALRLLPSTRGIVFDDEIQQETFAKRLFSPPALLANAHLLVINSALPLSLRTKIALFARGLGIMKSSQQMRGAAGDVGVKQFFAKALLDGR